MCLVAAIDDDGIVREILPELVGQLVKLYSSEEFEWQEVGLYGIIKYLFVHHLFLPDCHSYHGRAKLQVWREGSGRNFLNPAYQVALS
jgi:hypothetical protein